MRYSITCFILLLVCAFSCRSQVGKLTVISNENSNYSIYTPSNPSEVEIEAASVLQKYLQKVFSVQLPIAIETNRANAGIFVGSTTKLKGNLNLYKNIKNDGFLIEVRSNDIIIGGKEGKSALYGVYKFLNEFVGIERFAPDLTYMPKQMNLLIIPSNYKFLSNPAFSMRDIFNDISYDDNITDWFCLTHMYKEPSIWGIKGHTFFKLVSPEKYFKSHPEFFSLINGKRKASQLCFSNIQVRKILCENLEFLIRKSPDKKYWMVGQEDVGKFCQCENCKKLYQKYGGESGALLFFINSIARSFPNKIIGTFAYHETLRPPLNKSLSAVANVLVCYAPIEAFHERAYTKSKDKKFALYLNGWSSITSHLMVWDYIGDFNNMLMPYPNISTFADNIKFFRNSGVQLVYEEGVNKKGGNLKELKTYILSKLLWNPDLDVDSLVDNFCKHYYGNAAPYVVKYIHALNASLLKNNDKLRFWGGTSKYLGNSFLKEYDDILENASQAVSSDKTLLKRVNMIRMGVDMAFLKNSKDQSGLSKANLLKSNSKSLIRIKRIRDVANQNGVNWIMAEGKWNTIEKELIKLNK